MRIRRTRGNPRVVSFMISTLVLFMVGLLSTDYLPGGIDEDGTVSGSWLWAILVLSASAGLLISSRFARAVHEFRNRHRSDVTGRTPAPPRS